MRVPLVDLSLVHGELDAEIGTAIRRVIEASAFAGGPEVEAFEQDFAAACGTRHCVGVSSGTAALELILRAAGIGEGRGGGIIVEPTPLSTPPKLWGGRLHLAFCT